LEVMGMAVHNGRLIGGTLPLAEVYEYEGDTSWSLMARLDKTPDVKYRRAWAMAEHGGRLFCSTLPSGRIYGYQAGVTVSADDELAPGWQHVLVSRKKGRLQLYVAGRLVKEVALARGLGADPGEGTSLKIG